MKHYIIIILFLFLYHNSYSQSERKHIREGNKNYNKKEFGNSEVAYQRAVRLAPKSFAAKFNLGDALYKQKKYDKAEQQFKTLIESEKDKTKLAMIYHNLGNTQMKLTQDLIKNKKVKEAINQVDKAINAYKKSLLNNPKDKETKFNISYAKWLKKQLENQQKQQKNNKDDKNKDDKNKDDKNKDDKNKDDKDKNDKNKENKDNKDKDKQKNKSDKKDSDGDGIPDKTEKDKNNKPRDTDKDGKPDHEDNDSDNDGIPDEHEAGNNPEKPKDTDNDGIPDYRDTDSDNDGVPDSKEKKSPKYVRISKEDAIRLLEAIKNDEKAVQAKVKRAKAKAKKSKKVDKDW